MSEELLLFILRIVAGLSLLAFMGTVAYFLQRDYRLAAINSTVHQQIKGRLVVLASQNGRPAVGTVMKLTPSTSIGRAPSNTIQITDTYASNEHALLIWRLGHWWLEDQHSSNGTLLNGVRVRESVVLAAGDIIGIGNVEFRLELE